MFLVNYISFNCKAPRSAHEVDMSSHCYEFPRSGFYRPQRPTCAVTWHFESCLTWFSLPYNKTIRVNHYFFKTISRPTVRQCAWNHLCMVGHTPKPPVFFTFCCPWQTRRGQVAYKGNVDMIIVFFPRGFWEGDCFSFCFVLFALFSCAVLFLFCRLFFLVVPFSLCNIVDARGLSTRLPPVEILARFGPWQS